MHIVEYFDKTRIINTATRFDRRKETERKFEKYGLPVNNAKIYFFEGIRPADAGINNILIMEDEVSFPKHILEYGYSEE